MQDKIIYNRNEVKRNAKVVGSKKSKTRDKGHIIPNKKSSDKILRKYSKSESRKHQKSASTSSLSSFTVLPSIKGKENDQSGDNDENYGKPYSPSDFTDSSQLSEYLSKNMPTVTSRTMDLMIMEMRKLDRDRDRVLVPETVRTVLQKYQIPVTPCLDALLDMFADDKEFVGMTNYENLVKYLEVKRIDKKNNVEKTDNFILYESEHSKAGYKRNK